MLDLTNNKRIDAELLERIMTEVESMASLTNAAMTDEHNCLVNEMTKAESEVGKSREAEHLVEFLGKVLQQVHFIFNYASLTITLLYFSTKNNADYLVLSRRDSCTDLSLSTLSRLLICSFICLLTNN